MARICISLPDEVLQALKDTKPPYRPMSQHIVELAVEALEIKKKKDKVIAVVTTIED